MVESMSGTIDRPRQQVTVTAAPLRKQVIALLRQNIAEFEYQPGERLREQALCERFGVSRTVVREALRHLEAEGIVQLVPNRGPIVALVTEEEARSLYEVRDRLESLAAKLCAERATEPQKARLMRALRAVEASYRTGTLADELHAKDAFYEALTDGAGSSVLTTTLRTINARAQDLRGLSLQVPGRTSESLKELRQVVEAIQRGDAISAHDLASAHVRKAATAAFGRLHEVDQPASASTTA